MNYVTRFWDNFEPTLVGIVIKSPTPPHGVNYGRPKGLSKKMTVTV